MQVSNYISITPEQHIEEPESKQASEDQANFQNVPIITSFSQNDPSSGEIISMKRHAYHC